MTFVVNRLDGFRCREPQRRGKSGARGVHDIAVLFAHATPAPLLSSSQVITRMPSLSRSRIFATASDV
jgi:hypothetical protein